MREADPHRAQLRHRRRDLAGDEVEAARARPERDLPLDPHGSETRSRLLVGEFVRWWRRPQRPTAGRPAKCPARAPPASSARTATYACDPGTERPSRTRRAPRHRPPRGRPGPRRRAPPSARPRWRRSSSPTPRRASPRRWAATAGAVVGRPTQSARRRAVAAVGRAREARVEHDPAAARELGDHRHRAPGDEHVPVRLRARAALVGRRQSGADAGSCAAAGRACGARRPPA